MFELAYNSNARLTVKNPRKHYFAVEKVAMRQRKLIELTLVSDLCGQYHIQTSMFYNWQKQFFERWGGPLPSSYLARRRKSIKSDESPPFTKRCQDQAMALFHQIGVYPSGTPLSVEDAIRLIDDFVGYGN